MRVPALATRALLGFGTVHRLHRPHATNNTTHLAIRQFECEIGEEECGSGCSPEGTECCYQYGYEGFCMDGYYCMSFVAGCCRNGEICSDVSDECMEGTKFCVDGCIPDNGVCCDDGTWCRAGSVCTDDGFCETGTDEDDDVLTTTTTSTRPRTTTTTDEEDDEPTPTTDFGPAETDDADEPIPTDDGEEEEEEEEEEPTTTRRAGGSVPTGSVRQGGSGSGSLDEGEQEDNKNSAGQIKMSAGGLLVALVAGVALFV